ncbi:MAG: hypothetical protein JOZ72_18800 [Alphaproteobacteria bacterium]|nr:hypothetical protein [Alphaproteobacteria bacterium]
MQMLANIVFGAALAGFSLGPAAWADAAKLNHQLCGAVMTLAGLEQAQSPLDHAVAKARSAFTH